MPQALDAAPARNLFGKPGPKDLFAAADPESTSGREALVKIASKIGGSHRPGSWSDIPAGSTYLAQFVSHDLDFPTRDGVPGNLLDLGLIYGDGPKHDAYAYQVPGEPGAGRHLLRIGLPRSACTTLDARAGEARSEVLVPSSFSDSNLPLGQMQALWALMHNAIARALAETRSHDRAFDLARRINRGIYGEVIRRDVLGTWLMPRFRERYAAAEPRLLATAPILRTPREFAAGVGRLGHGLETSTARPHDMPLTEDWLVDFSSFFAVGSPMPQRTRALGPHVARPFATGLGVATDGSSDPLVLRDLIACTRGGVRSVRSLIARATEAEPSLFEGCFAEDEATWIRAMAAWLADTGLGPAAARRLAADPPLTLFLMLEAEADTDGRSLGALGSVIMGETIAGALPAEDRDPELRVARAAVFRDGPPASMAEVIRLLQRRDRFAEGARPHPSDEVPSADPRPLTGGNPVLDIQNVAKPLIPQIEVADYIEMGRIVAQWATEPATRPRDVDELKQQLDGIAVVPDRIRTVEFVQSGLDHLVLRLPAKEMIEESLERMSDPFCDGRYPLPQFYADHCRPGFGPVMTPLDTLLARVGDHTIAQGR